MVFTAALAIYEEESRKDNAYEESSFFRNHIFTAQVAYRALPG